MFKYHPAFLDILSPSLLISTNNNSYRLASVTVHSSNRSVHYRSHGLRLPSSPTTPTPSDLEESGANSSDSDSDVKKSRHQKKREARRAVRWGMELASFTAPQIKRILSGIPGARICDALMLVNRLGPDVREGKRRQYNYIGKLFGEVKPELMDALILTTKDGDRSRLQAVSGLEMWIIGDDNEDFEETEYEEEEDDEEDSQEYINVATKWLDGLINKDLNITNEVYAVRAVDFDCQELRKFVQSVHVVEERTSVMEENEQGLEAAKKPLTHFLHALTKQMSAESSHIGLGYRTLAMTGTICGLWAMAITILGSSFCSCPPIWPIDPL